MSTDEDAVFSPKVYDLRQQIQDEKDPTQRDDLMIELAREALKSHDPTNTVYVDEYHAYFDELEIAATNYKQAARRVARLICDGIDSMAQEEEESKPPHRRRSNLN